jgi:hypothetical protein
LFDAHLEGRRMVKEAEDRLAAGAGVHLHIGRPPRADAFLGGEGAINLSAGAAMPMRWMRSVGMIVLN